MNTLQIGSLNCTVVGPYPDGQPKLVVLLCHGFGAPGSDLVPLAEEILATAEFPHQDVVFIFPAAPLVLDSFGGFEGRAWWMINMERLAEMMGANNFSELRRSVPPGIVEAREMLNECLDEVFRTTGLGWDRLLIGGFSQGAMLTADTVLTSAFNPRALIQMSGTLICEDQWREKLREHAGMKVVQSHGRVDPVLPFAAAEWLRDLWMENGCDVDFLPFHGVHTIPMEMLGRMTALIEAGIQANS